MIHMPDKPLLPKKPVSRTEGGRCLAWRRALICIDLQDLSNQQDVGIFANPEKHGLGEDAFSAYQSRLEKTVLPNVQRLQKTFRQNGDEVIHVRIQSLTVDGRDRSPEHKALDIHVPPDSPLANFLPGVGPQGDEIIINKTASGVFIASNLEYILRNLCVSDTIFTGVFTNECISSAVRSASDLGFDTVLVSDATAAPSRTLQDAALAITRDRYATVLPTSEVITRVTQQVRDEALVI